MTHNVYIKSLTNSITYVKFSYGCIRINEFNPTYLLVIGALIGYFRQQHAKSKVPGALNIPKDLLKSTDFNKLWTLLYVVLLPLSYLVKVFVYAVYALMWLVDIIGSVVRCSANKLYRL